MAIIPKSLRKNVIPGAMEQRQKDCRTINQYGECGYNPTITKSKRSKLFHYIAYIYLPVGLITLIAGMLYLNQQIVIGVEIMWMLGYFTLTYIDEWRK